MNYLENHSQVFAFNIWDINSAQAVMDAASELQKDIILQTSASLFPHITKSQLREFVTSYKRKFGIEVWLHLDHCRDLEKIKSAITYGWDSVMIDASDKTIFENIEITNYVTKLAHANQVSVEAEIGQIRGIEEDIENINNNNIAIKSDIDVFLKETNVDMLAVAFGNMHGVYQGKHNLQYDLVEYVVKQTNIPFVVHGGSGLSDDILKRLLSISGVKKINISTDIKLAYKNGILEAYKNGCFNTAGFQPIEIEKYIHKHIKQIVIDKLVLVRG